MKESQRGTRSWGDTCGDVEHLVLIEQLLIEGVEGLIAQSRGGVIKFLSYCHMCTVVYDTVCGTLSCSYRTARPDSVFHLHQYDP